MASIPYVSGSMRVMTLSTTGSPLRGKRAAGEKIDRHHEKIHDELKALHVLKLRADGHAKPGKNDGGQYHEQDRDRNHEPDLPAENPRSNR